MSTQTKSTTAPTRSLGQRMEALKRANDIRVKRSQLKKDLRAGAKSVVQVLTDPPEYAHTMKVFDLLLAVPKYGRVKAARLLNQCRISQSKTVGGMSERQRREMVTLFGGSFSTSPDESVDTVLQERVAEVAGSKEGAESESDFAATTA